MAATVICLYARKGGAGRSLMTQQLAGVCAERNARVLVIDQDPQASISKGFFGRTTVKRFKQHETAAAIYDENITDYSALIRKTHRPNISLVPSSDFLQDYDKPVLEGNQEQFALKRFVDSVVSRYDVIWIDTPPNASNLPAWATLVASDFLMSPVIPEIHHVESIPDVTERVSQVTESANPTLVNLGLFITGIDNRTAIHRLHHQLVRQRYGAQVFDTVIPLRTDLKESAASEPIVFYKPKSEAAELVRKLLDEAVSRMHQATTALAACEEKEPEKRAGNE